MSEWMMKERKKLRKKEEKYSGNKKMKFRSLHRMEETLMGSYEVCAAFALVWQWSSIVGESLDIFGIPVKDLKKK